MMFLRVQFLKLLLFYLLQLYLPAIGKCLLLFFVSWSNKILLNKCLFTTTIFTSGQKVSVKVYKNVPLSDMIDKSTDNFVAQHYFYNLGRINLDQNKQRLIGRN